MADTYSGSCFCGKVSVTVAGAPVTQGFCHCEDCRSWSGAPVTSYALWPSGRVSVSDGAGHLARYSRTGQAERCRCAACGSLLMVEIPGAGLTDVFPLRLGGYAYRPQAHVYYARRVIDMADGLPKFEDLPETAGGSGRMISD